MEATVMRQKLPMDFLESGDDKRESGLGVHVAKAYELLRVHGLQQERGHICILEPIFQAQTFPV